jgi:hypothetical protein
MPQFIVTKGQDAHVLWEKVFEADSIEHANQLAEADKDGDGWVETGDTRYYDDMTIHEDETEEFHPEDQPVTLILDIAERNIILAALRLWQRTATIETEITDLASDHTTHGCFLTDDEIDTLIEEKINV